MTTSKKRNTIDWNKKNNTDENRITEHLHKRGEDLDDEFATDAFKQSLKQDNKKNQKPEEDEYHPFFNISLIEDEDIVDSDVKSERETLQIAKQQYQMEQRSLLMDTAILKEQSQDDTNQTTSLPPSPDFSAIASKINKDNSSVGINSEDDLAKLILEKSGRRTKKQNSHRKFPTEEDQD